MLLADLGWDSASVDGVIFVSQTPDHFLPATACVIPGALGLPDTPLEATGGIDYWFKQNFDYLQENQANPATFMNRRSILTGLNGVSDQVANTMVGEEWNYLFATDARQWTGAAAPIGSLNDREEGHVNATMTEAFSSGMVVARLGAAGRRREARGH